MRRLLNRKLAQPLAIGAGIGVLTLGLRLLQLFEPLELNYLDWLFRQRSPQLTDERIVLVVQTNEDVAALQESILSDATLVRLLDRIQAGNPRTIALDLFRDLPEADWGSSPAQAASSFEQLQQRFRDWDNLYGIFQRGQISPPPALPPTRQGDASLPIDPDGAVRRNYLFPPTQLESNSSWNAAVHSAPPDSRAYGINLALALAYLAPEGIRLVETGDRLQLGKTVLPKFHSNDGGYQNEPDRGYQLIIDWRSQPLDFPAFSVSEVLAGAVAPEQFRDRLVIIGSTVLEKADLYPFPYTYDGGNFIFGVEIIANFTSQLLDAALIGNNTIRTFPEALEWAMIFLAASVPSFLIPFWRRGWFLRSGAITAGAALALPLASSIAFSNGWWLPIVAPALSLFSSIAAVLAYYVLERQRSENRRLAEEVARQRQQLQAQAQLVALGTLSAAISHDLKNPLGLIHNLVTLLNRSCKNLRRIAQRDQNESLAEIGDNIGRHLDEMLHQLTRINRIMDLSLSSDAPPRLVGDLVDEVVDMTINFYWRELQALCQGIPVEIRRSYQPDFPILLIARQEIAAIAGNLFKNAVEAVLAKHSQLGETYNPQVTISLSVEEEILLVVADNGFGIPSNLLQTIYDPFVSGKNSTGLGLYIVKSTAERLNGRIEISNQLGEGVAFRVFLPRIEP